MLVFRLILSDTALSKNVRNWTLRVDFRTMCICDEFEEKIDSTSRCDLVTYRLTCHINRGKKAKAENLESLSLSLGNVSFTMRGDKWEGSQVDKIGK
jgi:hypothetical protein